ncbi:MAG: sodium:proton antiporter NhaD, partial [Bacteroidia bacterium]|nr:sodium:proton antiporter NhaD [Bacteroidia bacterium]
VFVVAYLGIVFEHSLKINKSAFALFSGVVLWLLLGMNTIDVHDFDIHLGEFFSEISGILFFLLGAMTTVEIIDGHNGFDIITSKINQLPLKRLFWIVGILAFLLSAVLDNLTTTILMVSLVKKMVDNGKLRWYLAGLIVISANAGGAFSPIGDVTTTMLWIGGQITSTHLIANLLLPSIVCFIAPAFVLYFVLVRSKLLNEKPKSPDVNFVPNKNSVLILSIGLVSLISVPVIKNLFHVPPYMGMLLGLSVIWILTELIARKRKDDEATVTVSHALRNIDTPSILFFLGILLSVDALQTAGILTELSNFLTTHVTNEKVLLFVTGILSAVVDNVPLVAAFQGMYPIEQIPIDSAFWHLLCYATGTGGSLLIIGSAAGVVAMGIENISFGWYLKRISILAAIGFVCGYLVLSLIL